MSGTPDPLTALGEQHVDAGARHGALVHYADICRADAAAAPTAIEAEELLREARAAEARACAIREGRA